MTGRAAVFVDRDGTINVERHFLRSPDEVELLPGAAAALRRLHDAGLALVVTTNQSGVARGYLGEADLARIHRRLAADLRSAGGPPLLALLHCPHHPEAAGPYGRACSCRKPGTGLYEDAARTFGLDPRRSFVVGDSARDVLPGLALGARGYLVRTGKPPAEQLRALRAAGVVDPEDLVVADLTEAADRILAAVGVTLRDGHGADTTTPRTR